MEGRCSYCTRSGNEPPCRYPQIHNAAVHPIVALVGLRERDRCTVADLTIFATRHAQHLERLDSPEAGEVADIIKRSTFSMAPRPRDSCVERTRRCTLVRRDHCSLHRRSLFVKPPRHAEAATAVSKRLHKETAQAKADEEQTSPTPCVERAAAMACEIGQRNDQGDTSTALREVRTLGARRA